MTAALLILVLAAAGLAYVVAPLLRKDAAEAERVASAVSAEMDLHSRHDMIVASLKDLEEDRATDKLDDSDYHAIKDRLTAKAVDMMKQMDELEEQHRRDAAPPVPRAVPNPSPRH